MVLSEEKKKEYIRRLLLSRLRILAKYGFYGLLLMHMIFSIDETCETVGTDGQRIFFALKFLDELSDSELDFILMHEIMHIVLQHCFRYGERDEDKFNIACDIVVNSNILHSCGDKIDSISLTKYGTSAHCAPNGKEGYEYTAEEVYEMLPDMKKVKGKACDENTEWDDHKRWGTIYDNMQEDLWIKRIKDSYEAISIRNSKELQGMLPLGLERLLKELEDPKLDWREILNNFVQEEIVDYSFVPPDKRFSDSEFFLPDFNEKEDCVEDILFMIDTSGSMDDDMITEAYSEVKGAIDQYGGALRGWLGFFDAVVVEPQPFSSEEEFKIIKPGGGGGTDFYIIFEYVKQHMSNRLPASIVILTDGKAFFPKEYMAMGIPVLWLINNDEITPPWGKVARLMGKKSAIR